MVYTVTFNPSLDYIVTVDDFKTGMTNRTTSELMLPGGKGLNVSQVLTSLGVKSTAIYFSAGFVGEEITRKIEESGINAEEIKLPVGCSRINLKLRNMEGTEINGRGPDIAGDEIEMLYERLDRIKAGDILVLAGSIPPGVSDTIYSDIMERLSPKGIRIVVDATKDLLVNVLGSRPFLIKPNNDELGEIFGVKITSKEQAAEYAGKLIDMGAENVLVSLASEGAVLVCSDGQVLLSNAPEGTLINSVGSGDAMVAGFLAGWLENGDMSHAFKLGVCSGSASAFSEFFAEKYAIMKLYEALD